ncbi:MAG TPA: 5-formyltetrahydrofolate cyclo-ligase [Verrucomicrobiae bacterium]|jgi:5-formyltetrahydrofolate cyclo-ligase
MDASFTDAKATLRQKMRTALADVSPTVRLAASIELCDRLRPQIASANQILFYAPLADELDVWPLLEESIALGVTCALPFFDVEKNIYGARQIQHPATEIITGKFGVREPSASCTEIPLDQFNLVLVPGMAFDARGNRLGRGRGFYDRLLMLAGGIKCGIGYDGQLLAEIPTELHDAKVDFILTPSKVSRRQT